MLTLWLTDLRTPYDSPLVWMGLNFVFLTLVSLVITVLVARSFLDSGKPGLLLVGCGTLFWGATGMPVIAISLIRGSTPDTNCQITLFNTLAWLSACCHLAGVALPIRWNSLVLQARSRWLAVAATGVAATGGFVVAAVLSGWTPVFFTVEGGPTAVRQLVLLAASAMFVLTAALLREQHRTPLPACVAWYSLALLLIALALAGLTVMSSMSSALAWLSRATQYLSACYMLIAAIAGRRTYNGPESMTWAPVRHQALHAYGIAITLAFTAAIVRLVFFPMLGPHGLFVTFYPAVMLAALYAGFQSGVAAAAVSVVLGSYFWIDPVESLRFDDHAALLASTLFFLGAVMVSRIIESMHRAIGRMQENEIELEKRVGARTQEIAALNTQLLARTDDAEAASRAKSAFLSTMSHEIRTPLTAIIGLTALLADAARDRRQRDYADKLQLSAQTLRMLIDDILDFSRIEAGALRLEQVPFSLNTLLRTMAAIMSTSLRDKPIEVLFDVDPALPDMLVGDALRLQQILLNLAGNAVKFTDTGEIVIALRCIGEAPGQVTLQFTIRDTGIGIPANELERIFEVFTQADDAMSRQYGGTGLGLAISARIAELMGSRIEVESTPGQGSEFRFALTLSVTDARNAAPVPDNLRSLSILIVDDHPQARDVLARACASHGWHARAVESGPAGLEELRRSIAEGRDYDLLLLDWRMPGMDGIDMLRQAYATKGIGLPLVILMTPSFELEHAIAAGDGLHLDGVVAKPMTAASLLDAVTQAYSGDFSAALPLPGKNDRRLAGRRLLVAEDNAINQQVIEQTLTRAGARVVMVGNGADAVEALKKPGARFDAVLMDLQMPVMDGYTASKTIREELGIRDLPVIAVTAYSGAEDREKSSRHGMTGHLVKPIDIEDLLDILAGFDQDGSTRDADHREHAAHPSHVPILDTAAAMKTFGGDMHKHTQLLQQFILTHGADPEHARRHFLENDVKSATQLIHGLRGTASLLQASALARAAAAAAHALRHGPIELVLPLLAELQEAMQALARKFHQNAE